jgi:hypothetical protein
VRTDLVSGGVDGPDEPWAGLGNVTDYKEGRKDVGGGEAVEEVEGDSLHPLAIGPLRPDRYGHARRRLDAVVLLHVEADDAGVWEGGWEHGVAPQRANRMTNPSSVEHVCWPVLNNPAAGV